MGRYFSRLVDPGLSRSRRLAYLVLGLVTSGTAVLMGLALLLVLVYPFTPSVRHIQQMKVQQPTVVLSADGQELRRFQPYTREWVPLEAIAPFMIEALVATEDHRFYEHGGVDHRRLVASMVYTVLGDRQGGSTITMQLARNLYPHRIGRSPALLRKLKEIVTAYKIESAYAKDEILETYLNTVPYLYNVHGIEMGARTYFGKGARDLDVLESATLVGMLKATSYYNPVRNPDRSVQRRNVVLAQMVKHGALDPEAFDRLKEQPLHLDFERQTRMGPRATHFSEHVRRWLERWAEREGYDLNTAGLRVYTTLDLRLQQLAEEAVMRQSQALQDVADVEWSQASNKLVSASPHDYGSARRRVQPFAHFWAQNTGLIDDFIRATSRYRQRVAAGQPPGDALSALRSDAAFIDSLRVVKTRLEAGFVAIDPRTGYVKAWVGSRSYATDKFDHVVQARRQPGSTFKPFVYAAALEGGYTPEHTFPDAPVEIKVGRDQVWRPVNAGGFSGEEVTLRTALAQSKNSVTAQLIEQVGPRKTARLARRMGVSGSRLEAVPSLALGTSEVTLLEMASAYATIAAGGVYRMPVVVTRIEAVDGTVLYEAASEERRALSEPSAHALIDMMRGVVDGGTGQRIRTVFGVRCDVAGKTGTTQDNADGWFLLMHPHLVAGAWVGFNDPRVTFRSDYWGQGAHNALYLVGDFYRHALRQGRLDPRPSLGPVPVYEQRRSFLAQVGDWFNETIETVEARFEREQEQTAEARPQPQHQTPPPSERRSSSRPDRRRREQYDRRDVRVEVDWDELEETTREVGRLADDLGRLFEAHDDQAAEAYRRNVERYVRHVERYVREQQRRDRRRHDRGDLDDLVEDILEQVAPEMDRHQRAEIEEFVADLQREMRGRR